MILGITVIMVCFDIVEVYDVGRFDNENLVIIECHLAQIKISNGLVDVIFVANVGGKSEGLSLPEEYVNNTTFLIKKTFKREVTSGAVEIGLLRWDLELLLNYRICKMPHLISRVMVANNEYGTLINEDGVDHRVDQWINRDHAFIKINHIIHIKF